MQLSTALGLLYFAATFACSEAQQTYYVATDGSDSYDGTPTMPLLTLGEALTVSQAGDTIVIGGGQYSGSDNIGLTFSDRTLISGADGYTSVTFEASAAGTAWTVSGEVILDGLSIQCNSHQSHTTGIQVTGGKFTASNLSVNGCAVGVSLSETKAPLSAGVFPDTSVGVATSSVTSNVFDALSISSSTFHCETRAIRVDIAGSSNDTVSNTVVTINNNIFHASGIDLTTGSQTTVEAKGNSFQRCRNNISGGGALHVVTNSTISLYRNTFQNCSSSGGPGGAIYFQVSDSQSPAHLKQYRCQFLDCFSTASGGAIWIEGGNLEDSGSSYAGNTAIVKGGAIAAWNTGYPTIAAEISLSGGALLEGNTGDLGGAMALYGYAVSVKNSTLAMNTAQYSAGAALFSDCQSLIEDVIFTGNKAGIGSYGGALYVTDEGGVSTANITNTNFISNYCTRAGGGAAFQRSSVVLETVGFMENASTDSGGGFIAKEANVTGTGVLLTSNAAARDGGGYFCSQSTVALERVAFFGNFANSGGAYNCGAQCTNSLEDVANPKNDTISC